MCIIVYPFQDKPKTLTLIPPLDNEGRPKVSIGFIAYHKAVPIIDFRYLGAPAKVNLNWDDPWYTKFENPNLKRHHKDALMSFLYIEPYEVRHEILTRVKDLEQWMDLGLKSDEYIEVEELDGLKQRIGEFSKTLPAALSGPKYDLIYFDGNHQKEPTLEYFAKCLPHRSENAIFIFDDIHWSHEMEGAWQAIKEHQEVTLSIDAFFWGMIFFKEDRVKQHFRIRM